MWTRSVLDASLIGTLELGEVTAGRHTLTLAMVDPGGVVDSLVLEIDGATPPAIVRAPDAVMGFRDFLEVHCASCIPGRGSCFIRRFRTTLRSRAN